MRKCEVCGKETTKQLRLPNGKILYLCRPCSNIVFDKLKDEGNITVLDMTSEANEK